jgi:hypothetical protein
MALRKLTILSLFIAVPSLFAETAADYVHRGAQKYIFGQEDAAAAEVSAGLAKFPNDPELREMAGLFHRKKPPQQNQQQQQDQEQKQDQQSQQKQQQQSQNQQSQGGKDEKQEKEQKSEQPRPGETPSPSPGQQEHQEQDKGKGEQSSPTPEPGSTPPATKPEGSNENATPSPAPAEQKKLAGELKEAGEKSENEADKTADLADAELEKEGQMSERQALALLESLKDEEARVRLDERKRARRVYKDW